MSFRKSILATLWRRAGGRQDCRGKNSERLVARSRGGEVEIVAWNRGRWRWSSKYIKELLIDLQRSGEEGRTKLPPGL